MQQLQRRLSRLDLSIKRHVHDDDKMYGSVTAKNISEKLARSNLKVAEKDVLLDAPIKVRTALRPQLMPPAPWTRACWPECGCG